jgi:hypothetical protein
MNIFPALSASVTVVVPVKPAYIAAMLAVYVAAGVGTPVKSPENKPSGDMVRIG